MQQIPKTKQMSIPDKSDNLFANILIEPTDNLTNCQTKE